MVEAVFEARNGFKLRLDRALIRRTDYPVMGNQISHRKKNNESFLSN